MVDAAAFGRGENKSPTIPVEQDRMRARETSRARKRKKLKAPRFRRQLVLSWHRFELFRGSFRVARHEKRVFNSHAKSSNCSSYIPSSQVVYGCCLLTGTFQYQLTASP